ncbi:glycosyltransferase family 4 protein [Sphingobacterium thalpophilum]|nr:glycosyltransferase family 4 protein [Sphingobacterium thalpophilum]
MVSIINILFILNSSSKHAGSNKSFLNIILNLDKSKFTPIVVIPNNGEICNIFDEYGIKYHIISYFQDIYPYREGLIRTLLFPLNILRFRFTNYKAQREIESISYKFKIDIIHTNVGTIHFGYRASLKCAIPHIWHLREYQDLDFNFKPFPSMSVFKNLLKVNSYNIAISKDIYNYFELSSLNSIVIYNGIKNIKERIFNHYKDNYFLYAGRLEINKGILDLLEVFKNFKDESNSSIKLFIAGDTKNTSFKRKLEDFLNKNNLSSSVCFLGMRDDIDKLMQNAKALIVPSRSEGFGRITVEALFNGCLVIGYDNAGTSEILRGKNYGFLYKSQLELIQYLRRFDNDEVDYVKLINEAHQDVIQYSNEQYIEKIQNTYINIIMQKPCKYE